MRTLRRLGVAGLALAAGAASAQPVEKPPDWLKRPTAQDLMAVWPAAAWERGEGGKAILTCTATVQGALRVADPGAECLDEGGHCRSAGGGELMRDSVGIDDGRALRRQRIGDCRLARADAAGQSDAQAHSLAHAPEAGRM